MLIHDISPESMLLGTMVPIPKNKRQSLCNSDNYRTFAIAQWSRCDCLWRETDTLSKPLPHMAWNVHAHHTSPNLTTLPVAQSSDLPVHIRRF